ncbi:MAG: tetratricopeptide repeat protein, partial [Isosphaeraceae bacterium]
MEAASRSTERNGPGRFRLANRIVIVALALAGVAAGFRLWWRGRPDRHLAEAERSLVAGDWGEASRWLELPDRSTKTRERAGLLRARLALASGRPKDAIDPLRTIAPTSPHWAEAAFWKGRVLHAVGNTPQAIVWLKTALQGKGDDPETLRWLASAAYELGDRATLDDALRTLTSVDPRDARAWRTLGLVILEDLDGGELELERARDAYQRSLRLDPGQPKIRHELAEVLVKLGVLDEAERQLRLCEGHVAAADWADLKAQLLWKRGEREGCRAVLDAAL